MTTLLTGIPETLLIPLWARAVESKNAVPIVRDEIAARMVAEIDYDFSKFESAWMSQTGCCVRTMLLDRATLEFLARNPGAVVVNLGSGLCTRHERLAVKQADWYELDVPESIALRRRFFKETQRYRFIGKSMLDESWMQDVEDEGRPVLIIAEGLFMYFEERELRSLFMSLMARFPDAEMLLDIIPHALVGRSRHNDSLKKMDKAPEFKWGIKNSRDMEALAPGVTFLEEWNYYDHHKPRWKWFGRVARLPLLRAWLACRIIHLRLGELAARERGADPRCSGGCCTTCTKGDQA